MHFWRRRQIYDTDPGQEGVRNIYGKLSTDDRQPTTSSCTAYTIAAAIITQINI